MGAQAWRLWAKDRGACAHSGGRPCVPAPGQPGGARPRFPPHSCVTWDKLLDLSVHYQRESGGTMWKPHLALPTCTGAL